MGGSQAAPAAVPTAVETVISGAGSKKNYDQYFRKVGGEDLESEKKKLSQGKKAREMGTPLTDPGVSTSL